MIKTMALCAAVFAFVPQAVFGQGAQVSQEDVRLQVQVLRNGTVVAEPVLKLLAGSSAAVTVTNGASFVLTPDRIDAITVRVTCDVTIGTATPRLRVDLKNQEPGVGSVTTGSDVYEVKLQVAR